ncbi:RNB domain-containing ribonuclease [Aquihabitans sp. McL0605]|uniref:RNB domain-containing ribonuclease n=1 Tax=Aquihabitans sp. McL0605 TaxID=3415671 RepID=UPI003CF2A897
MVAHRIRSSAAAPLGFDDIRRELGIPGPFPPEVLAQAQQEAGRTFPDHVDATDLELVTIDPAGSKDLDQAVAIETRGDGWRVSYAIADVASWVDSGSALDLEAHRRTQTYYAPDRRVPLHPEVLGEGAASLLPDGPRPAALWTIDVDASGTTTAIDVHRAMVRSRTQLTYQGVQEQLDAGTAPPVLQAFPAIGAALLQAARARGAIELGLPEQSVVATPDGSWTVELRADLPIEQWNAQISLLTGRAAASLMLDAGIGVLRTVPKADEAAFPRLRAAARNLGIAWPDGAGPGDVLASLDTSQPRHAAFADLAAELLRGAAYTPFSGAPPADPGHAGVGAPYAHVTAPLRRLVDRFGTEICLAVSHGRPVPGWVTDALPQLPEQMAAGDSLSKKLDRAVIDATEAFVLTDRVGKVFAASVVETGASYGTVVLDEPPVRARCDTSNLPLGASVHVRCTLADVATRQVRFERVS